MQPARQRTERESRGQSTGQDIRARGIGALAEDLEGLAQYRGDSEEPASQRRMLRVIAEDLDDAVRVQEMPASLPEDLQVLAARSHIERLVDRQPGSVQGQDDGHRRENAAEDRQSPGTPSRSDRATGRRPITCRGNRQKRQTPVVLDDHARCVRASTRGVQAGRPEERPSAGELIIAADRGVRMRRGVVAPDSVLRVRCRLAFFRTAQDVSRRSIRPVRAG